MIRLLVDTRGMNSQQAEELVEDLQKIPQVQIFVLGDDTAPYTREVELALAARRLELVAIQLAALDHGHHLRPGIARAMVLECIDRVAPRYTEFIASRRGVYGASRRRP